MKILHAPSNVCNISWAMAQGLRELGHEVEVWNHGESPNNFPVDRVFDVGKEPDAYIECLNEALAADFDVFHFHGTRTLIPAKRALPMMWDLPLLKAMGKKVVFTFHGSDVRLRSQDIADPWSFHNFAEIDCDEEKIAHRLAVISAYADHLTVGNVLNKAYVAGSQYIPKPIDLPSYEYIGIRQDGPPVVLHATRRRETKGTDAIISAVESLKQEGLVFDFRLVENVSYSDLMSAVADADIVVEKVLSGDAGVLALEAMAMGKIAVSRIRDEVYARHPEMPVVNANPETIVDALRGLVSNSKHRMAISESGREYVRANHSPMVIARELEALYASPIKRHSKISVWPETPRIETIMPPEPADVNPFKRVLEKLRFFTLM